jgi:hypothetical protein
MRNRCRNPKNPEYDHYGGRGISVCERWDDFRNFLADMGERPAGTTLDRWPNPDGDYEPSNCRWATHREQRLNSDSGRRRKPARLWLRPARPGHAAIWIIKDNGSQKSTGCGPEDHKEAEAALTQYLAARQSPGHQWATDWPPIPVNET